MSLFVSTIVVMNDRLPLNEFLVESYRETVGHDADSELVCVDNGSTDGTSAFLDQAYINGDVDLVISKNRNVFLGPAWNEAAEKVDKRTSLIGKVDNDTYFKPGWLAELRRVAEESKADAIICTSALADWPVIFGRRGEDLKRLVKARTKPGGWLHKGRDYGGNYYLRAGLINDGVRLPADRSVRLDTNFRLFADLERRGCKVVRLLPGFMTWEKLRWTDPRCKAYYDRTFGTRNIMPKLASRRANERKLIAEGKLDAYWEEAPCPASS